LKARIETGLCFNHGIERLIKTKNQNIGTKHRNESHVGNEIKTEMTAMMTLAKNEQEPECHHLSCQSCDYKE
jgi:hypothetical protein